MWNMLRRQMGCIISQRCKEQHRCLHSGYVDKSALVNHCLELGHQPFFSNMEILFKSSLGERLIWELLEIRLENMALNHEDGLQLNSGYN